MCVVLCVLVFVCVCESCAYAPVWSIPNYSLLFPVRFFEGQSEKNYLKCDFKKSKKKKYSTGRKGKQTFFLFFFLINLRWRFHKIFFRKAFEKEKDFRILIQNGNQLRLPYKDF